MNGRCEDIYQKEIETQIKTLKRFREAWLKSSFRSNEDLFQYGDDDFYFYRFAVSREEASTKRLLDSIIYQVLERYNVNFEIPNDIKNAPFDFIVVDKEKRLGYTLEDFYADEDINAILDEYGLDSAYYIRTLKNSDNEHIKRENEQYIADGVRLQVIILKDFFLRYCNEDEYKEFESAISEYIKESKKILGYQAIKFLSAMNLSARKAFEEKVLLDWEYSSSKYQIINSNNEKIQNLLYLDGYDLGSILNGIKENYLDNGIYRAMVGNEDFAESFITSEWLYHSLKGTSNFDFTAIVSGYLKSIEQLLHKIVMLNIDNGCIISLKSDQISEIKKNGITVYEVKRFKRQSIDINKDRMPKYPYIDFITDQKDYMDSSIGTFEFFLRYNPHIFVNTRMTKTICDMVSCFRTECRNGYFHTHNLHEMSIVEKTRENAILLYAILLGCVKQVNIKKDMLGIVESDSFNDICKEIREIRHYSVNFTFEYEDGTIKNMIYDSINNTPEYDETGTEHYESLIFFDVPDFSLETYELLDNGKSKDWKFILTKDNLPKRIYCYDVKKNLHEVSIS